jgi:hypothetical protein
VNLRVAEIINMTDPLDPVLKLFHGIFSEEYERVEDKLDKRSQLNLKMWAHQTYKDPGFKYVTDFVMNQAANETIKRAPITVERVQYGRAQIANMILFKREIQRLSNLYEEMLKRPEEFDEHATIEM